jgi:hypothetical protein
MPTRRPNQKRGAAGSRGKRSSARGVPSKRKKRAAKQPPARKGTPARATKKVGTKQAGSKHARATSTKAQRSKQTVPRKAGTAIAHAVTTVRKALVGAAAGAAKGAVTGAVHGAIFAVTPGPAPAGTASPQKNGEETGGGPSR